MKALATDLIFVSQIKRDGSGVIKINAERQEELEDNEVYDLNSLSITNKTYIASGFNSYVVKLKNK